MPHHHHHHQHLLLLLLLLGAPLLLLLQVAPARSDFDTDMAYLDTCNRTSPITLFAMNQALMRRQAPPGRRQQMAFKCFLHCLFAQYGWMDADGGFALRAIHRTLSESAAGMRAASVRHVMYHCTAQDEAQRCERAFHFIRCVWQRMRADEEEEEDDPAGSSATNGDQFHYEFARSPRDGATGDWLLRRRK